MTPPILWCSIKFLRSGVKSVPGNAMVKSWPIFLRKCSIFRKFGLSMLWKTILSIVLIQNVALASEIETILNDKGIRPNKTAVYAVNVHTGTPAGAYHEETQLNPASTAKIFASYCVLKELGPEYQLTTRFHTNHSMKYGTIKDLGVTGNGDPGFVSESLWVSVQNLKMQGIRTITGDIIIDGSPFDSGEYPGRQDGNERAYNALLSAAPLNFNSVALSVFPNPQGSGPAVVSAFPAIPYFSVRNQVITRGKSPTVTADAVVAGEKEEFVLSGAIPAAAKPITIYRSVARPAQMFGEALKNQLLEVGIQFSGKVRHAPVPAQTVLLYEHLSKPLSLIVRDINKYSNNFATEQLVKHLGGVKEGLPGSTTKGLKAVKQCLANAKIPMKGLHLENGSGLSYKNTATARQLVETLMEAHRDFSVYPEFTAALSIYGTDGTMRKRNFQKELLKMTRAKTGSLNGISTLAGYLQTRKGNLLAYAILMNDCKASLERTHQLQDKILARLYNE